jgi:hypothetical protein
MEAPVKLVPLNCIRCGSPIPAGIEEVAWACEQCGQGQQLGESGLLPLEIHYAQGLQPPKKGRPFWVCEGRVALQRDTYGRGKSTSEAEQFWSRPRNFIIPAFTYPLDEFASQGPRWLQQPPVMQPGPSALFEPVTVPAEDVQTWAEFVVVALEAERKDKIKTLAFNLEISAPQLWVLA